MKLDQYLVKIYIEQHINDNEQYNIYTEQILDPIKVEHDQEVHEQHLNIE